MKKIRVGIVNYLNTRPLLYGIQHQPVINKIELIEQYPSKLVDSLMKDEIDLGLLPVAAIPDLPEYHFVGQHGIASDGEILTVSLFSDVPLDEIEGIYLDYQSRTSVSLLKYLLKESWKIGPALIPATDETYRSRIIGKTAGLVIGDRAFEQRKMNKYFFDLGMEWKKHTGLPFVYAGWISNKKLPEEFINDFDNANAWGVQRIDEVIRAYPYELYDLRKYYTEHLRYFLDEEKQKGLNRFLSVLGAINNE